MRIALVICLLLTSCLASAEALENVNPAKLVAQCNQWLSDHNTVAMGAKQGHCDEMKEFNESVAGVEDSRREKITRLTNEVCASKDIDAWYGEYARFCMGRRQ